MKSYLIIMKICLLGNYINLEDLANYFVNEGNQELPGTASNDSYDKLVEINNQIIELKLTYKLEESTNGIIFVFDVSTIGSIENFRNFIDNSPNSVKTQAIPFIIAGIRGKLNKESEIDDNFDPYEIYQGLEKDFQTKVFEVSIETGQNIDELFNFIIKTAVDEDKMKFNVGVASVHAELQGFDAEGEKESFIATRINNRKAKLHIFYKDYDDIKSENEFDIDFFRKDTLCFIFPIMLYNKEYLGLMKKCIEKVRFEFRKDIPIVVVVSKWGNHDSYIKTCQVTKKHIFDLENKFNCKVFTSDEENQYLNELWKYVATECLSYRAKVKRPFKKFKY